MKARIVGLGRRWLGDDALGPLVIDHLRGLAQPELELIKANDPSDLVELVQTSVPLVIVDAALDLAGGQVPGTVHVFTPASLAEVGGLGLSSHGVDVSTALRVAETLVGAEALAPAVHIVAVVVAPPRGLPKLSPQVEAAVPEAARRVLELLR